MVMFLGSHLCLDISRSSQDPCSALAWAERQADRLDPLKESPPSIIDRVPETEPAYPSYYGYRKPEPPFRFPKPLWRMK